MINRFTRLFTVLILFFFSTPVLSQSETVDGYSIRHFTDEDGLPQNSINDLLFDKDGYLWLASQVGLVRFNGSSFNLYYPDDKPAMESNIKTLGKDEKGLIYFQTLDQHLYCYSGSSTHFLSRLNEPHTWLLNANKQVFDFNRFLHQGSTAEQGRRQDIFQRLSASPRNFFVADAGRIYLIDSNCLYYYDGQLRLLSPTEGRGAQCFVSAEQLYVVHGDSVIAVYAGGTKIHGASMIEGGIMNATGSASGSVTGSASGAATGSASGSHRLYSCGHYHHLLANNRLYRLSPEKDGHVQAQFLVDLGFIPNISSIEYNAGADLLIVSTNTEGFYFLRRNHFRINGWSAVMQDRLSRHRFGPMALYKEREILTDKFIFTPAGDFEPVKGAGPIWQRCLYIDKKAEVWAARDRMPRRLSSAMNLLAELPALDANIVDYAEDARGNLYCLTERSLWRLDRVGSGRLDRMGSGRLDSGGFRQQYIPPVREEDQQNESMAVIDGRLLWIASTNGLTEYDPEKKTSRSIPELAGTHVRAIHTCRDGSILIGTYGEGYFYYYQQRFFRMPMDKNDFLITAHGFLEDNNGIIWIPCNKGLFKVPKADMDAWCKKENDQLYYYYYGRQAGLQTNEFNGGFNASGLITPEGFVALLSMKGMVCFYTDSLETDFPQGSIMMAHYDLDGQSPPRTDTLRLPAGYNSLLAEISCPYMGDRNNLYLHYNLAGLNEEWKEVPADGMVNLSRLSPGNYTLRVRKVNGFGKNNYQYRQWSIIVPVSFYHTSWFWTAVILIVLAVVIALVWKLKERKKKLLASEQALQRTNRQREKLISLVIHDLRSPLRFLTMMAGELYDNQGSLTEAELRDRAYWVKKGAQDVYHFSEDFLLWVTSQKDNFKLSKQLFFVRQLLQEIVDFYQEQALQKGNRLSYEADGHLQVWSDPHLVLTILRNLTDNANKYTHQGDIRIVAKQQERHLLILVADTGRGMSPEQAAAFLGEGNIDNLKSGSQLGHKFIVDLTQRLNGSLSVESYAQKGTTVTLRLPMDPH